MAIGSSRTIRWIKLLLKYRSDPKPNMYNFKELGFIWLYSSCFHQRYTVSPIITNKQWDELCIYLTYYYGYLDKPLMYAIPEPCVKACGLAEMDWKRGMAAIVDRECGKYAQLVRCLKAEATA